MPIAFEHEADVLLWAFCKLIESFQKEQHMFVAQCVWGLSALVGLQLQSF